MSERELLISAWVTERNRSPKEWEAFRAEHAVTGEELETAMLKAVFAALAEQKDESEKAH